MNKGQVDYEGAYSLLLFGWRCLSRRWRSSRSNCRLSPRAHVRSGKGTESRIAEIIELLVTRDNVGPKLCQMVRTRASCTGHVSLARDRQDKGEKVSLDLRHDPDHPEILVPRVNIPM